MITSGSAFLDACRNQTPEYTPVWYMRQAGRSLPEYRALRGSGSILDTIAIPELVAEITLQPVKRYGVDAAILYSDIMVPLHATGFGIDIVAGTGPVVAKPFHGASDLDRIRHLDAQADTPFLIEAIKILIGELKVPLIGFAGAPFTLASYLIEGGPSRNHTMTKKFMYENPDVWDRLANALADLSIESLRSQIEAGCAAVQLFDSWAGCLSRSDYRRFALPATQRIFRALEDLDTPRIVFGVGSGEILADMSDSGADVVGVDWRVSMKDARRRTGNRAIQGNLDPAVCLSSWETVELHADRVTGEAGPSGHIFNLGHGVLPETDPDILKRLTEHVHLSRHR